MKSFNISNLISCGLATQKIRVVGQTRRDASKHVSTLSISTSFLRRLWCRVVDLVKLFD